MNIQDAVVLVLSNDNLNFSQIKEAYDALKNTNYAELTKLRVMARNKLNELQNDGKSLEINELLAASDLLDTISSNDEKSSENYHSLVQKLDNQLADYGYLNHNQIAFLENYSSQIYSSKPKWSDISEIDRNLLTEEGKNDVSLAPSEKQINSLNVSTLDSQNTNQEQNNTPNQPNDNNLNQEQNNTPNQPTDENSITINMTLEEAVKLANGDLNSLTFDQIENINYLLQNANAPENSPEANALARMRGFADIKIDEASKEDFSLDMENAPEIDAWLRVNDEATPEQDKAPRNVALHKKINDFYKTYDEEHKLTSLNSSSGKMLEGNFDSLEEILQNYDPLARDENGNLLDSRFAKIEEFYDEMQIDNSDKNSDFISNVYFKRDMVDLALHEAQTTLMIDENFAKLSPEEKKEAVAKEVLSKMQEGISSIISTEMGQNFLQENATLIEKLKDENLSDEERNKLLAEFQSKTDAYKKALNERLQQQTNYMAEQPVPLTENQKDYLSKIYKKQNKQFNPDTSWNDLSEQDKDILIKGAETLKELALSEEQKSSGKAPAKPEPFHAKAANLEAALHNRSQNLIQQNKRIAQKSGFMKMWQKVKEFDQRLSKSHPKMWGFAKNFALSSAVSLTTGGFGLAVLAAYKANKVLRVVDKKAKANNMSFFTYLKKNKTEAIALATSVAGAIISVGFAGGDIMTHGISSAGLIGQTIDHTIQNSGNVIDGITEMASNIHGNAANISVSDMVDKAKNIDKETLWNGFKKAITNPKTALRAGLALTSGTAAAMVNLAHGDKKKAKEAFWGGLLGAGVGLAAAEAANVLGDHQPTPDNHIDGVTGETILVDPPHGPDDGITPPDNGNDGTTPPDKGNDGTTPPDKGNDGTTPPDKGNDGTTPPDKGNDGTTPDKGNTEHSPVVDSHPLTESDKALYEQFLKRRSIANDPALATELAKHDMENYSKLMEQGNEKAATDYARQVYNQTEKEEGEIARTLDGDDNRKISIAKAKANSAYNDYHEKQLELRRMNPNDPDYEKTQAASDKALKKYTDSMVKLSQKELSAQIDRMEKDGTPPEQIEAVKSQLKVLKRGHQSEAVVDQVVNEKVAGLGTMESDKNFYNALLANINKRNMSH